MLRDHLASLDVPTDGSAKLISVHTVVGDDGCRQWTVVFRETTPSCAPPTPSAAPKPATPEAFAPVPAKLALPMPAGTPGKSVAWAQPMSPPTIKSERKALMDRIFPLKCQVKTYAWGKLGTTSLVGVLAEGGLEELEVTENVPYAELWMGSHPSGPSMVMLSTPWRTVTPLSEWIKLNPSLLGPPRSASPGRTLSSSPRIERRKSMLHMAASSLPYLFKILSVGSALSIQAHPDKKLAQRLHARQPDMYKDDNHKPEMAVAITPFEALCSFQPAYSILENCRATPELVALVGESAVGALDDAAAARSNATNPIATPSPKTAEMIVNFGVGAPSATTPDAPDVHAKFKAALGELFRRLMTAPAERVREQLDALMRRVQSTNMMLRAPVDVLAMRLHEQYPGDVGVFCAYLLNYKQLAPGEALYLGANEPHAYLAGDCAEVMATSDNVVRAGLTPKWKDTDTLCEMLTYRDGTPHVVTPTQPEGEPHVWRYTPPPETDEFLLDRVEMPHGAAVATLPPASGLAIVIVIRGTASIEQLDEETDDTIGLRHELGAGAVHLVCPHTELKIRAADGPLLLFRAVAKEAPDDIIDVVTTGLTTA